MVKMLAKSVVIIYASGSIHDKCLNQSRFKVVPQSKFPAGLGVKNG